MQSTSILLGCILRMHCNYHEVGMLDRKWPVFRSIFCYCVIIIYFNVVEKPNYKQLYSNSKICKADYGDLIERMWHINFHGSLYCLLPNLCTLNIAKLSVF